MIPFYRKALGAVILGGGRKKDGSVLKCPMLYHTEIYNKDAAFTEKKIFFKNSSSCYPPCQSLVPARAVWWDDGIKKNELAQIKIGGIQSLRQFTLYMGIASSYFILNE